MTDAAALLAQLSARSEPAADPGLAAVRLARASIDALVLRLGQSIEARVVGPLPGGLIQFAAGGESFALKLETPLPAGTPVTLKLSQLPGGQPAVTVTLRAAPPQSLPPAPLPSAPQGPPVPSAAPAASPPAPTPSATAPQPASPLPGPAAASPAPVAPPASAPVATRPPGAMPAPSQAIAGAPGPQSLSPVPTVPPSSQPVVQSITPAPVAPQPGSPPAMPQPQPQPQPSAPAPVAPPAQPVAATSAPPAASPPPAVPAPSPPPPTASVPGAAPATAPAVQPQPAPAGSPPTTMSPAPVSTSPVAAPVPVRSAAAAPPHPPLNFADPAQAAARQDSAAPLLAKLAALTASAAMLPRPVFEAALRVLAGRLDLNRDLPDGKALQQAVLRSGVVSEPGARPPPGDARSALLQLRQALTGLPGGELAAIAPVVRPAPPLRGEAPRPLPPQPAASLDADAPETARQLLGQTDAALSRLKLLQLASGAPEAARSNAPLPASSEFRVEIPLLLGAETGILQLMVERDGKRRPDRRERGWRVRFALDFSATGQVGAEVAMFGRAANVAIWAAEPDTARALDALLPELASALAGHGLEIGALRVRRGAPKPPARTPGQLLDSAR